MIWHKIAWTDAYYITECGQVKRVYANGKEKILRQFLSTRGYYTISISQLGKVKRKTIHRLVARQFLKFDESLVVNHLDGNKKNNHIKNLEMITEAQNKKHAALNGLMEYGQNRYNAKLTKSDVEEIRKSNQNQYFLAKKYGVSQSGISKIKNWKTWTHE